MSDVNTHFLHLNCQVYGNNVEIQALSEMYNRPIHIYSYSTGIYLWWIDGLNYSGSFAIYFLLIKTINVEPINIGSYNTDTPPIQLSYHHGNHYNSLVNPRRSTIGAGLGFSCLQGVSFCNFCTLCLGKMIIFSPVIIPILAFPLQLIIFPANQMFKDMWN
jgi:hypothetical protein